MASPKRIGFLWGEGKITLVEYKKSGPPHVYSAPLGSKTSISSPFSSNLTEDVQITAVLQKLLKDNQITGGSFYASLPMKEIILRSFIIPFVKRDDIQNAIKFEAKKYLPIDIQDLSFVFYSTPFIENKVKRLQIIFFAVRKELLDRYVHIFNQVNTEISYCEPSMVSLTKVLLSKKEIDSKDNIAFLTLDKTLGRICFIDQGIPQFIREFFLSSESPLEENKESAETLNLKIVNEVANSFDFYIRQFSGDHIEQMLVSAEGFGQDLFNALETELKIKLRKVNSIATTGEFSQSNDMDTIGACIDPPSASLGGINFLEEKNKKVQFNVNSIDFLTSNKEILFICLMCFIALVGINIFFNVRLKVVQMKYNQLSSKEGDLLNSSVEDLQNNLKDTSDKLTSYKSIRTKSDVVAVLLRIASHIPKDARLLSLTVNYIQSTSSDNTAPMNIDMQGDVVGEDPDGQIAVVNKIYSDFKKDKEFAKYVKSVSLVSLNRSDNRTDFVIHCS